jgi:hypothetical protein
MAGPTHSGHTQPPEHAISGTNPQQAHAGAHRSRLVFPWPARQEDPATAHGYLDATITQDLQTPPPHQAATCRIPPHPAKHRMNHDDDR